MQKEKELLIVSIFTLLTVIMWIFFELTKTVKTTTIDPKVQKLTTPLDSKIDKETLQILEDRSWYLYE